MKQMRKKNIKQNLARKKKWNWESETQKKMMLWIESSWKWKWSWARKKSPQNIGEERDYVDYDKTIKNWIKITK